MVLLRYLAKYRFRDMGEMIKNDKKDPLPCDGDLKGKIVIISGSNIRNRPSRGVLVCGKRS